MRNRIIRVAAIGLLLSGVAASSATAKPTAKKTSHLLVGINDEAFSLYGNPAAAFDTLRSLNTQVLRVNLYWGGTKWAVANSRPADPTNPGDPAYNWGLYDRIARYAHDSGIQLMFTILFTPSWANGGAGRTHPPKSFTALRDFAHAAAVRYSGFFNAPAGQLDTTLGSGTLPAVTMWTAWNESRGSVPKGKDERRIQLGNINVLLNQVRRFYGSKNLWITEYGYETNPPDHTLMGTSWAKQAQYMRQAYAIARANPRISM